MKQLVEFKLHNGMVPYFVMERCPYTNGPKYIGVTHDDETCYLPDTIIIMPENDVITRVVSETIYAPTTALLENQRIELTTQEKTDLINGWLNVTYR